MSQEKITMGELRAFYPGLAALAEASLREPLDPDKAGWLDGPSFAKWLCEHGLEPKNCLGESVARQVRRWAEGDAVSLGTADHVLSQLGHHITELPDELWRNRPNRSGPRMSTHARELIKQEIAKGVPIRTLSERYGVSERLLRSWRGELKQAA